MLDRKAARLFIISILLYLGLSLIAGQLLGNGSNYTLLLLLNAFAVSIPAFLLPALFFRRKYGLEPYSVPSLKLVLIAAAMGFGCMFLNLALASLGKFITYGIEISSTALDVRASLEGSNIWIMLLTVVIVPAVSEEYLMRGTLLETWRRTSPGAAVVLTALLFALIHLAPSNILVYFALGALFGQVYLLTRNVWMTVIIHAMNNLISVLLAEYYLANLGAPELETAQAAELSQGELFNVFFEFALLAAAILIPLYFLLRSVCRRDGIGAYAQALTQGDADGKNAGKSGADSLPSPSDEEPRGLFRQPLVWVALITLIALNILFGLIEFGVIKLG